MAAPPGPAALPPPRSTPGCTPKPPALNPHHPASLPPESPRRPAPQVGEGGGGWRGEIGVKGGGGGGIRGGGGGGGGA